MDDVSGRAPLPAPAHPKDDRPTLMTALDDPPRRATLQGISRPVVVLLSVMAGAAGANVWYVTPLLNEIADDFGTAHAAAGLLVTAVQSGYVLGLVFLLPLGDRYERRALILGVLCATALAAVGCALAPSIGTLGAGLVILGTTASVAQIIVPLASALAGDHERGHVVGVVMSGLLIGVLSARTVSGLIAEIAGWRGVFAFGAALMVVLAVVSLRMLPRVEPSDSLSYLALLRSVATIIRQEPLLRQRMAFGALTMAQFSMLWTTLTLLLGAAPYRYAEGVIGLFGLVGICGVLLAPRAGRLSDRGRGKQGLTAFLALIIGAWIVFSFGDKTVAAVIAGIILLDLGVQGALVSHQAVIFALRPEARSRINTAFMSTYFIGGVGGTVLGTITWEHYGWHGVCVVGATLAAAVLVAWGLTYQVGAKRPTTD